MSGHVVFLGGHDAAHQDKSLVVHVMIPFRSGSGTDSESAAISFVNDLEVGAGLRTAALAVRSHIPLLSLGVISPASTKKNAGDDRDPLAGCHGHAALGGTSEGHVRVSGSAARAQVCASR